MKIRARGHVAFISPDEQPDQTESGLYIVHEKQQSTMTGTVVALGDGLELVKRVTDRLLAYVREQWDDELADELAEQIVPAHGVAVGDRVIFSPDVGEELRFEKQTLICLLEDQILAVIEGE